MSSSLYMYVSVFSFCQCPVVTSFLFSKCCVVVVRRPDTKYCTAILQKTHKSLMPHLNCTLVYFTNSGRWSSRHQNTPQSDHALACCTYVCQRYQMFKIFGTEVVHKGTEGELVVVPKVTSRPFRYRNGYVPKWTTPWSRNGQVPNVTYPFQP